MSSIKKYVEETLEAISHAEANERMKVKFSITLEGETNARLNYVAKKLETNRAALSSDLLQLALSEVEKTLGLNPWDPNSDYSKAIQKETTGYFINGKKVSKEKYDSYDLSKGGIKWVSGFGIEDSEK